MEKIKFINNKKKENLRDGIERIEKQKEKYEEIIIELQKMVDLDQNMRKLSIKDNKYFDKTIDYNNTKRMKELLEEIGYLSSSKVGEKGSYNAWLLVQHADHDVEFQKKYLELMKLENDEKKKTNIAYLEDRVAVNSNKKQIYGTQFYIDSNGEYKPRPISDFDGVDERRQKMGLGLLSEYQKIMQEKYNEDLENKD